MNVTTNNETETTTEDPINETNQAENTDDNIQIEDDVPIEDKQTINDMVNPIVIKVIEKTMKKLLERNIDIKSINQDVITENIADFIINLTLSKDNTPENHSKNQDSHISNFDIDIDKSTLQTIGLFKTLTL